MLRRHSHLVGRRWTARLRRLVAMPTQIFISAPLAKVETSRGVLCLHVGPTVPALRRLTRRRRAECRIRRSRFVSSSREIDRKRSRSTRNACQRRRRHPPGAAKGPTADEGANPAAPKFVDALRRRTRALAQHPPRSISRHAARRSKFIFTPPFSASTDMPGLLKTRRDARSRCIRCDMISSRGLNSAKRSFRGVRIGDERCGVRPAGG
jgi:hypothetical protein